MCNIWQCVVTAMLLILPSGCVQEMADQKRLEPLEQTLPLTTGRDGHIVPQHAVTASPLTRQRLPNPAPRLTESRSALAPPVDMSTSEATELLLRGQQRFNIHCVPCHDWVGTGNGLVARRGFPFPPSYHTDRLRAKPIEHFYHIATEGKGKMPAYGDMISEQDRWAIAAYVRALQFSQYADEESLEPIDRTRLSDNDTSAAVMESD